MRGRKAIGPNLWGKSPQVWQPVAEAMEEERKNFKRTSLRQKKGFSLVEIIISTFIAVIIISGIIYTYRASWDFVKEADEMAFARTLAISKLEELKGYTSTTLHSLNNTTFSDTLPNNEQITGVISVSSSEPPKVTITMQWGPSQARKTISISSILFRPIYEVD
jgi:type II secretory pathway pseudopilin PulG